jgi:hypothetical protein
MSSASVLTSLPAGYHLKTGSQLATHWLWRANRGQSKSQSQSYFTIGGLQHDTEKYSLCNRKHGFRQFLHCCVRIRCCGSVFWLPWKSFTGRSLATTFLSDFTILFSDPMSKYWLGDGSFCQQQVTYHLLQHFVSSLECSPLRGLWGGRPIISSPAECRNLCGELLCNVYIHIRNIQYTTEIRVNADALCELHIVLWVKWTRHFVSRLLELAVFFISNAGLYEKYFLLKSDSRNKWH